MMISPLYYFIDAGYGILLKGAGIELIWESLVGISMLAVSISGWACGVFDVSSASKVTC